jgi:hypothetical protein
MFPFDKGCFFSGIFIMFICLFIDACWGYKNEMYYPYRDFTDDWGFEYWEPLR